MIIHYRAFPFEVENTITIDYFRINQNLSGIYNFSWYDNLQRQRNKHHTYTHTCIITTERSNMQQKQKKNNLIISDEYPEHKKIHPPMEFER